MESIGQNKGGWGRREGGRGEKRMKENRRFQ